MAYNNKNYNYGSGLGNKKNSNNSGKSSNPLESEELSADDYAIIAAGLAALGEVFAFLSLVKAKQVAKETSGQADIEEALYVQSRKKAMKRKSRPPR